MEDRSVELWVAGKAGWYRISPAKGYLPLYNRMVQAVDMYYFLMDKHFERKKRLNPTFKNLCEQVSDLIAVFGAYPACSRISPTNSEVHSTYSIRMATARQGSNPPKHSTFMGLSCCDA